MNISKLRFILLGASALSLGTVLGTLLWLKITLPVIHHDFSGNSLDGLRQYGSVPEFSLVERSNKKIGLSDLRGKVWVADFIYTRCTDTCPLQTADMAKLQEAWTNAADLKLVSFSVDPERDTPAVLSQYADRFKADAQRWLFLTGGKEEIAGLVGDGFRLAAQPAPGGVAESGVIMHSPRFVLVDRQAKIRGYYDNRDPDAMRRLKNDVATLLNDKKE
jgi:protein SCO1/2